MEKKDFVKLYAIRLGIEKRRKRIAALEELQADGPQVVADVVKSSSGEGNATVICNATVRGTDAEFLHREQTIAQLKARQAECRALLDEGIALIESCEDELVKIALNVVCLEGGRYRDAAAEWHRRGVDRSEAAVKQAVFRWMKANLSS